MRVCKLIQDNVEEDINGTDNKIFLYDAKYELLYYDESRQEDYNLPVPVYAYIRPDMGHKFILYILLSLCRFETEVYLKIQRTLCDDLNYHKLISTDDECESFKQYSTSLLWCFIKEQLVNFPIFPEK